MDGNMEVLQPLKGARTTGLVVVNAKPAPEWVLDSAVSNCACCKNSFTFLRRKHHCRHCGNIFCSSCTDKVYSTHPKFSKTTKKMKNSTGYRLMCGNCNSTHRTQSPEEQRESLRNNGEGFPIA